MTRAQALDIVRAICFGPTDNKVITPLLEQLNEAFQHPDFIDLIYHQDNELTPEEIVDTAIALEENHYIETKKTIQGPA